MEELHTILGDVRAGKTKVQDVPDKQKMPIAVAVLNSAAKEEGGKIGTMLRRAPHLGSDFAARVADGHIRFAETSKSFIAKITASGTKIVFCQTGSPEYVGIRAIGSQGLPQDKPFFVRAIRLRQVTSGGTVTAGDATTLDEAAGLDFTFVDKVGSTGSLTIKVGDREVVSKLGVSMFNNSGNTTANPGQLELGNPFWIEPGKKFEMLIDNGSTLPAKSFFWCELIGFDTYEKN